VKIWGVTMVRDEADIIEITLRHLLAQGLDHLLVADNMSRDGTREILDRLATDLPLTVVDDMEPAYYQSEKMTVLANRAAENGAEWIVPFDADEMWRAYGSKTVREAIISTEFNLLPAPLFDHYPRPTITRGTVVKRLPWSKTNGMYKVAFRWQPGVVIMTGNHEAPAVEGVRQSGVLLIDHYPWRSFAQYRRKVIQGAEAANLAGLPVGNVWQWREPAALGEWGIRRAWWRLRLEPRLRHRDRALRLIT
jgi:glycosyltransferase involved in cell wall biosynthesis